MKPREEALIKSFFEGSAVALARIISHCENRADGYEEILSQLFPKSRNAYRIGITCATGAGKSSLVDKMAMKFAGDGREIGIVAIDPSSPFTGGAVLGDRIRMKDLITFDNVFIRSMATRGSLGGLAAATKDVMVALDAFGKEFLLIETVGVGQVELDVVDACDTVIVVLTPESGDSIQAMKAGLLEIADIFAVNKSDREGADIFIRGLQSILQIKEDSRYSSSESSEPKWTIPIVSTIAHRGEGIDELLMEINNHRKFITEHGFFENHRKTQIKHKILEIIEQHIRGLIEQKILGETDIEEIADRVFRGDIDPYSAVRELNIDY